MPSLVRSATAGGSDSRRGNSAAGCPQGFTLDDRDDLSRSIRIFVCYCLRYKPDGGPEQWCKLWHLGPRWREKPERAESYWQDCLKLKGD